MNYNQNYAEIVRRFADPKGEFFRQFKNTMRLYRPTLSDDGIRDIYQDSFLEAQKNLMEGRVKENTSWNSYLIAIGLNLASKEIRKFGKFVSIDNASPRVDEDDSHFPSDYDSVWRYMPEEEISEYNTPEVQGVLGECLSFMNEKCKKILEWTLYGRLSSEEIAAQLNSTARSIITQRNRCKSQLVELVKSSLRSLGYEFRNNG